MGKLKPVGSEKLQGTEKIQRMIEISRYKENIPNSLNESSSKEYSIKLSDGVKYEIVKEKNGYVIKKSINEGTQDYLEPIKNRKYYSSYSQAFKRLNLITKEVNTLQGNSNNISLFTEGEEDDVTYVLKTETNEQETQTPAPAPQPAPATEPTPTPMEPVAEPETALPSDEVTSEELPSDDEKETGDEEEVTFKTIQKLTGKLTQKIRVDEEDKDDNDKYLKLQKLIPMLAETRSSNYDTWIKMIWCIINICKKENINQTKINRLIHQFSKLSKTNYDEDKVDEWIDKNIDKVKETGYGWNYLYQTCIKQDAPKYYEKLTQSYYNVKKDFETNHLKIIHPPFVVYVDENKENIIQPIPLCEKSYRHLQALRKETNKKGEDVFKKKRFIDIWLDDPQIRKYNKMVFTPPPLYVAPQDFNTWTDFEILKTPYIPDDKIIDKFLEYTYNLFDNIEVSNYILAYFANRLQNPANRNNVLIVILGEEGDGKNVFLDIFKNIVGIKYFSELESAKQLFDTHSCFEKEKLFICVNEAKGKDNHENSDILKSRITTETLFINPKNIQTFQIDNYCDYIMTTNNHNPVNIHDKSRRYLLVESTSYYNRNTEFFKPFCKDIVKNKNSLRIIYEYLMKYDVNSVIPSGNFQDHIPKTEIQQIIIKNNRDKIELFLRDLVEMDEYITENIFDEVKMKNSELFAIWCKWIETNKIKNEYNSISFGTRFGILIKKRNITDYIKKDTHSNTIINFGKLKNFFDNNP